MVPQILPVSQTSPYKNPQIQDKIKEMAITVSFLFYIDLKENAMQTVIRM